MLNQYGGSETCGPRSTQLEIYFLGEFEHIYRQMMETVSEQLCESDEGGAEP